LKEYDLEAKMVVQLKKVNPKEVDLVLGDSSYKFCTVSDLERLITGTIPELDKVSIHSSKTLE
jgi:adenosine/AMP kinase